jgi:hypothetical protein
MSHPEAAFCGDYCGKCPNYPIPCAGCIPSLLADCHFVKCGLEKRIEHCGLCDQFPCQKLIEFVPDDRPGCPPGYHVENLRLRASLGTDSWLESQRSRWR